VNRTPLQKQKPTMAEAVRAAKAEITRRESLRKQRQALKEKAERELSAR
jgi:hypothetical protein